MPDPDFYRQCLQDSFTALYAATVGNRPAARGAAAKAPAKKAKKAKAGPKSAAKAKSAARKRKAG
jgi:hypothetical protein